MLQGEVLPGEIRGSSRSWHLVSSLHGKQMGQQRKRGQILFSWVPESLWTVTAAMKLLLFFLVLFFIFFHLFLLVGG